jgi:subtilase family serine protease
LKIQQYLNIQQPAPKRETISRLLALVVLCALLAACGTNSAALEKTNTPGATPTPTIATTPAPYPTETTASTCPTKVAAIVPNCQTPQSMRTAYGVNSLISQGDTGKGQTIVDIVSFGSPTLQKDIDAFDTQFNLPAITIQQISPLNGAEQGASDKAGWAGETTLDVEIYHAIAPEAQIVVLTSPVAETEGTIGLPEFRQLIQYVIDHKLGNIVANSWGASEATLKDAAGQAEIKKWDTLIQEATTKDGITFIASSGDNGATDYTDISGQRLATTPTSSFLNDEPYVLSVGGTSLDRNGKGFTETAWSSSGGGFSAFYTEPTYQKSLSTSVQTLMKGRRGLPDVSANADPQTGLAMYENGSWSTAGGTSASGPVWAALVAIADQIAGKALGFINPGLYKLAAAATYTQDFHDITSGNNGSTVGGKTLAGWNAVRGWDPITGLGTPNAVRLLPDLVTALSGK